MVPTIQGIPVLLPAHEHPEFGDPGKHYHIDYRYLNDEPRQDRVVHSDEEPVLQDLKLIRREYNMTVAAFTVVLYLHNRFKGQTSICGKCPHKGMPVFNGQCVGHGLTFDEENCVNHLFNVRLLEDPDALVAVTSPEQTKFELVCTKESVLTGFELVEMYSKRQVCKMIFDTGPVSAFKNDLIKINLYNKGAK